MTVTVTVTVTAAVAVAAMIAADEILHGKAVADTCGDGFLASIAVGRALDSAGLEQLSCRLFEPANAVHRLEQREKSRRVRAKVSMSLCLLPRQVSHLGYPFWRIIETSRRCHRLRGCQIGNDTPVMDGRIRFAVRTGSVRRVRRQ